MVEAAAAAGRGIARATHEWRSRHVAGALLAGTSLLIAIGATSVGAGATARFAAVAREQVTLAPVPVLVLRGHTDQVLDLAFSDDGTLLASVGADRTLRLWDLRVGSETRTLRLRDSHSGFDRSLWRVAFSPNGWWVAASAGDNTVRLWEVDSGRSAGVLAVAGVPDALAFSPRGDRVAVASLAGAVTILDPETGRLVTSLEAGNVRELAFSADGRSVTTVGESGTERRWDLASGRELPARSDPPGELAPPLASRPVFAPNGMLAASAGVDGTIVLWRQPGVIGSAIVEH